MHDNAKIWMLRTSRARVTKRQWWLIAGLLACTQPRATGVAKPVSSLSPVPCEAPLSRLSTKDSLRWTTLPDLERCLALPDYREVRIVSWYEIMIPSFVLRVVEAKGRTTGALHLAYPAGQDYAQQVRGIYPTCAPAADEPGHHDGGRCRMPLSQEPDWAAMMATFDREDIWTLPDQGTDRHEVIDGGGIAVEVRTGSQYRRYAYMNADSITFPSHARIARIAAAFDAALRHALRK